MNKLGISLAGAALSGVVALSSATPALAGPAGADRTAPKASTVSASPQATAAVSRAQKLKRLNQLTEKYGMPLWENTRVKWQDGHDKYRFDWSTDGCSGVTDNPGGFHFWESCARHDFGYRNYKKMHEFSRAHKKRVDDSFHHDMQNVCKRQWGPYSQAQRKACLKVAKKYYDAVRALGHL
ncbi:phospholipase [Streptomyces decoyicus]|uniref:phospholipase n=1 Tax=Streptomyces decoyicus TaxID=249567 RepID=UPI00345CD3F1